MSREKDSGGGGGRKEGGGGGEGGKKPETDAGERDKRRSEEVERTLKENQREDRRKWIGSEFLVSNDTRETSETPHTQTHTCTHTCTHRVKKKSSSRTCIS